MKWLHFILSHSIFIAVCAVALAFQTAQLRHFTNSVFVYGFIFFATLCSYNFYWILSRFSFAENVTITGLLKKELKAVWGIHQIAFISLESRVQDPSIVVLLNLLIRESEVLHNEISCKIGDTIKR